MEFSATEWVLIATSVGTTVRWWFDRRDAQSKLATAKTEADKTVATLREAITAKNEELAEKDQVIDRQARRIEHLETLAFGGGSHA